MPVYTRISTQSCPSFSLTTVSYTLPSLSVTPMLDVTTPCPQITLSNALWANSTPKNVAAFAGTALAIAGPIPGKKALNPPLLHNPLIVPPIVGLPSAPLVGVTPMCKPLPTLPLPARRANTASSRRLLLGLRCRQIPRPHLLHPRQPPFVPKPPIQHRPNLRRRLLLRHPHDPHHRALRARKSLAADPRPEEPRSGRKTAVLWRRGCRAAIVQGRRHKIGISRECDDAGEGWTGECGLFRYV